MRLKLMLCLVLAAGAILCGCSTTTRRPIATGPRDVGMPFQRINGFAYETKPLLVDSRGLFYWFISDDLKSIYYEPCAGYYVVEPLKKSKWELVFRIKESYGTPIDLRTGEFVVKSAAIGKTYAAKLKGDHIVGLSEIE